MTVKFPPFSCHVSGFSGDLNSGNPLWHTPLDGISPSKQHHSAPRITIGDYFESARAFLVQEKPGPLERGLFFHLHRKITLKEIKTISVFLEKHGVFYHPARVEVNLNDPPSKVSFALNAAISDRGLALMSTEYHCLEKLLPCPSPDSPLPAVFGLGKTPCRNGEIAFFLAHWFKGYQEFHVTDSSDHPQSGEHTEQIALWQSDGSTVKMPRSHYFSIHDKASEILTSFYALDTFEQIFPWHHAAGDFIAKKVNNSMDVKLITVRGYSALFDMDTPPEKRSVEDIFQGLLLFLVNLSLRMRIDRIDGTGRYHLVHPDTIKATLTGFFRALGHKTMNGCSHKTLQKNFYTFLTKFDAADFKQILALILNAHPHPEMEGTLIQKNLDSHAKDLYHAIWTMGKN